MRPRWRTPLRDTGYLSDMQLQGDRLYYVQEEEVGCVSAATGKRLWQRPLPKGRLRKDSRREQRLWQLTLAGSRLLLAETDSTSPRAGRLFSLLAFQAVDGQPLWSRTQPRRFFGRALILNGTALVATTDGVVHGLEVSNGKERWRRSFLPAAGKEESSTIRLDGEGGNAAAQLGDERLEGFDPGSGRKRWSVVTRPMVTGLSGSSEGFAVRGGVAYADLPWRGIVAVGLNTGKVLWWADANMRGGNASCPIVASDQVVVRKDSRRIALDRRTGKLLWTGWPEDDFFPSGPTALPDGSRLLIKNRLPPWLDGRHQTTLSVESVDTLQAVDATTGRELWRWQPEDGTGLDRMLIHGETLLATDHNALFCFEPGAPPPLPTDRSVRRGLAQKIVNRLFPSNPERSPTSPPIGNLLRLIRLGPDATPALLKEARRQLDTQEGWQPTRDATRFQQRWYWSHCGVSALDLLADCGDPTAVPALIAEARALTYQLSLDDLADTLIHFGDRRAAPWLFEYARITNADPTLRQAALTFACRAGTVKGLDQQEVTTYLIAQLNDPKAPQGVRQFARFELLNDRGEVATRTALAAQQVVRTVKLLPEPSEPLPSAFRSTPGDGLGAVKVRDGKGVFWTVGLSSYLSNEESHLWAAQSPDGTEWFRPAFVKDLSGIIAPDWKGIALRAAGRQLLITLTGYKDRYWWRNPAPIHSSVTLIVFVDELYVDSDQDGLPDRLEHQIGTDPNRADSSGSGISDGWNKNPAYRPHTLTDEEGIYQAAVEGLCQLRADAERKAGSADEFGNSPWSFRNSGKPLRLPLPPGSAGIQVLGYPGPVLFEKSSGEGWKYAWEPRESLSFRGFVAPKIGLDGVWRDVPSESLPLFAAPPSTSEIDPRSSAAFHEFFPYLRSADGKRARVGWEERSSSNRLDCNTFDVEVRKIGDTWRPMECREVTRPSTRGEYEFPIPIRPLY